MFVSIDTRQITNRASFHSLFANTFGFFSGYGNNMDAWIDCMSDLDNQDGLRLSKMGCSAGEIVVLQLKYATDFAARQERLFQELLDCVSFVNWRRNEEGRMAILALSYCK